MSIIRANLKLYSPFQNRFHFYGYLLFLIICIKLLYDALSHTQMAEVFQHKQVYFPKMDNIIMLAMYVCGMFVTKIQLDVLTKPFSFCLPNHSGAPQKIILIIGGIVTLLYPLVLILSHPTGPGSTIYIVTGLFMGLGSYLLGSYLTIRCEPGSRKYILGGMVFIMIFSIISSLFWQFVRSSFERFIVLYSAPLALSSTILLLFLWKILLHPEFKRKYFSRDYVIFTEAVNLTRAPLFLEKQLLERLPEMGLDESPIDAYFIKLIKRYSLFSVKRSIAGGLYCMLDRYYTLNKHYFKIPLSAKIIVESLLLLLIVSLALVNKFGVPGSITHFFLLLFLLPPCALATKIFGSVFHNHLLPVRRSEYFKKSIILWLAKPIVVITWFCLVVLFTGIMRCLVTNSALVGHDFIYISLGLSSILWIMVIIPVSDTIYFYFEESWNSKNMILVISITGMLVIFSLFADNPRYRLISMAIAALCANVFFFVRLAWYWFKKDIVSFI